jgi:hypothetical protein
MIRSSGYPGCPQLLRQLLHVFSLRPPVRPPHHIMTLVQTPEQVYGTRKVKEHRAPLIVPLLDTAFVLTHKKVVPVCPSGTRTHPICLPTHFGAE